MWVTDYHIVALLKAHNVLVYLCHVVSVIHRGRGHLHITWNINEESITYKKKVIINGGSIHFNNLDVP